MSCTTDRPIRHVATDLTRQFSRHQQLLDFQKRFAELEELVIHVVEIGPDGQVFSFAGVRMKPVAMNVIRAVNSSKRRYSLYDVSRDPVHGTL